MRSSGYSGESLLTTMAESHDFIFVNYNQPNPRPTQRQRRTVSAFIGKHFRNRSAPARRAQLPAQDDKTPLPLLARKSSPQVLVALNGRSKWPPLTEGGSSRLPHLEEETDAVLEDLGTSEPRADKDNETLLIRPVVECYVPAYPPENRQKVVHILDFVIHWLIERATNWGQGPTPSMRSWVQVICSETTLFDAVAAFSYGIRATTLEDKETPSPAILWHKARALRGLQAKISTEAPDKLATWTANETILVTFYLMEGAARFGYEAEFRAHCLGLLQMVHLRTKAQARAQCASTRLDASSTTASLEDLHVMQAVGLVEGTEMASKLRHEIALYGYQSSSVPSSINMEALDLRYPAPGKQTNPEIQSLIDNLPLGFRDLAETGNMSVQVLLLLKEQLRLQHYHDMAEFAERQTEWIKHARALANWSNNPVEELACLGMVAFLSWGTAQLKFFPEASLLHRVKSLGRQAQLFDNAGLFICCRKLRAWVVLATAENAITGGATLKRHANGLMREFLSGEPLIDNDWGNIEDLVKYGIGRLWLLGKGTG
ncbi:hypothetical protein BJX68DRAFT_98245 [Aspergillus pseudodeflectus]|uniref:Fungal-specific transcription factor domain-containing protein n=1 Tax=Aspergillus pseudodeflectus TaxID=176178 RepID=A0ABR4K9R5_9EURO